MAKSAHLSKIESVRNNRFMENWEGNRFLRFDCLGASNVLQPLNIQYLLSVLVAPRIFEVTEFD
jgi:hypothetical protein